MSETTTPKRRGRQPSGKAMTAAERQRRYIERLKAKADIPVTDANQVEALAREVETKTAIIGTLNHQLETASRQLATQAAAAKREHRALTSDRNALEARLKAVTDELAQAQEDNATMRREILLLTSERDEARARLGETNVLSD